MKKWYVVHTQPRKEEKALVNIKQQAYEVYLPKYLKQRRHARKVDTIRKPLFPGYLFVKLDLNKMPWRVINNTAGVLNLVCQGTQPAPLEDGAIETILRSEDDNGLVVLGNSTNWEVGDTVKITKGPFLNKFGVLDAFDDRKRVLVLFKMLGRHVRANLSVESLEPVFA